MKYSIGSMPSLVLSLLLMLQLPCCWCGVNEKRLLDDLLRHYVKEERPVWDHEKAIELKVCP